MAKPFERFVSELNRQQVSLLLDTVLYFEEAPKLISIPDVTDNPVAVPLTPETLRAMLGVLDESEPFAKKRFVFDWQDADGSDELIVELPNGETLRQPTDYQAFSPV
jgi:hypothetical protein